MKSRRDLNEGHLGDLVTEEFSADKTFPSSRTVAASHRSSAVVFGSSLSVGTVYVGSIM